MARKKSVEIVLTTPAVTLVSLLNLARRSNHKVSEINSTVQEAVSNAVNDKRLHRAAFNIVKRLYSMPDEKLAECLYHLTAYLQHSGINDRVEKVGRLPLNDDAADNVVSIDKHAAE